VNGWDDDLDGYDPNMLAEIEQIDDGLDLAWAVACVGNGEPWVAVMTEYTVPNGKVRQLPLLTPDQARALAFALLESAASAEARLAQRGGDE
jgi:hypothetical protein